jgi:hypothetical protein
VFGKVVPVDGQVVISAWQQRAIVGRYVATESSMLRLVPARNWRSLEAEALAEIRRRGYQHADGQYACSPGLAERAFWPIDRREKGKAARSPADRATEERRGARVTALAHGRQSRLAATASGRSSQRAPAR